MDETARQTLDNAPALDIKPVGAEVSAGSLSSVKVWGRLTQRAEFQRVSKGRRAPAHAFTLQAQRRAEPVKQRAEFAIPAGPRVGLTVTKKVGNSVIRNRIRRRLREALRHAPPLEAADDHDYVLMARIEALTSDFQTMVADVSRALRRIHSAKPRAGAPHPNRDGRS